MLVSSNGFLRVEAPSAMQEIALRDACLPTLSMR
jgi:hypothetical protein